MAKFTLTCIDIAGDAKTFVYDNLTSELTDDQGNPVPVPAGMSLRERDYRGQPQFPATSEVTPNGKVSALRTLKIQLGLSCNYACDYCSQRFVPHADSTNPKDVDAFMAQLPTWFDGGDDGAGAGVQIQFWGGEPLVYWKTMKPLAEALREKYPGATFHVITNGSLLDAEKNEWLDRMGFGVSISHDGPGQPTRGPDPLDDAASRAGILDLYARLAPQGRIGLNAMVHRDNASRAAINEWFTQRFGADVQIGEGAFIDPYDEGGVARSAPSKAWARGYSRSALQEIRAGKAANLGIVRDKIVGFLESIANRRPAAVMGQKCGMDRPDNIAVDLKGNVLTCQNVSAASNAPNGRSHKIGHVSDLAGARLNTATHWSKRKGCVSCPVLQLCAGSCMFLEGDLWEASCENAFADNIPFFAVAIELLTGYIPVAIEGGRADRRTPFDMPAEEEKPRPRVIPIFVAQ